MDGRSGGAANAPDRTSFRVLGPVEILRDGIPQGPTTAQSRCVLALLLLDLGRTVTAERLITALWPDGPPASALNTVRVYVTRLRRLLADDPAVSLATVGRGWRLDCDPDQVDLYRFRALVTRARRHGPEKAPLLREALRLWRGPALADTAGDEWRENLRTGLDEERLAALEDRIEQDIDAGAARDVIPELAALVADHPVRERPAQLLMAALGASGRTGEALALYRKTRRYLVDELGVEPGPALQQEHRRLLDQREEHTPFDRPVPQQLPGDITGFTGRTEALARLDAHTAGSPVAVVTGIPGSGKTTLAVHWAHRAADVYPDGQLWADLRGFDPAGRALDPGVVLGVFLDALGVPPAQIPARVEARSALFRTLLAKRRMLIVLDNARDEEQVRPLLPGTDACRVLITARTMLTGLVARHGVQPVSLDVLDRGEARDLLAGRIGAHRADAEPEAVSRIIDQCARLPLALAVVAARAAGIPGAPLGALADELEAGCAPLDGFAFADMDLRAAFACSYRALSPAAARTFRLLGLHWGPDFAADAVAALLGEPLPAARRALGELVRLGLVGEFRTGRYRLHDLLAAYTAELSAAEDEPSDRRDAVARLFEWLLRTADAAAAAITPFSVVTDDHSSDAGFATPEQRERALAWFEAERAVLLGAVDEAFRQRFDTYTWQLARSLEAYLRRQNAAAERESIHRTAVRAAERSQSAEGLASAHLRLGTVQSKHGDTAEAREHLRLALEHFGAAGDRNGQADTCMVLCILDATAGDFAGTLAYAVRALELYARAGNTAGRVRALNNIGYTRARLGDPLRAREDCLTALELAAGIGDTIGEANVLSSLGAIEALLGEHARSVRHLRRAVALGAEAGERNVAAAALNSLGETYAAAGRTAEARDAWQRAAAILDELGRPNAAAVRARIAEIVD